MFKLTNETILQKCTPLTLNRGNIYFKEQKVKSISFIQEKLVFDASVFGTKKYNVQVQFDESGVLTYTNCSCPSYENYWGICKHIAAVLLVIRNKDEQGFFNNIKSKQISKQIFSFFDSRPAIFKKQVELEITYEFFKGRAYDNITKSSLSFRIGIDKLYVLKNIRKLFESIEEGKELELGKNFIFNPAVHEFKQEDRQLISMLKELYDIEKVSEKLSHTLSRGTLFKEKQVMLPSSIASRFFEIMGNRTFKAKIQEIQFDEMEIKQEDFPVEFNVTLEEQDLILDMNYKEPLIPMTDDGEYFFCGDNIYKTSKKQQENFKPFYIALLRQQGKKIRFFREDKARFVSEIIPFAEKAGEVNIDESVQSLIERIPLEIEVYLDRDKENVSGEVKFIYGEKTYNPFAPSEKAAADDEKIIVRDIDKERIVLDILGESDFKVGSGKLFLDQEELIFDFIYNIVPKLQEHSSVYYSESFKKTVLREPASFSGGIKLNSGTNMLEFSFSVEGIDKSELAAIFEALKANRKYHRLKDGSFLSLESEEIKDIAGVVDYLDFNKKDFDRDFVEIPRFRAFYLDQFLKNSGLRYIQRNHAFKEFVHNITDPEDADLVIPEGLTGTLREYQKFGFKWLKTMSNYGLGGILADDMGLGKTFQVLALVLSEKQEKGQHPSLIVVPTSLIFNWCDEIQKFAPDLQVAVISGNKQERLEQMKDIKDCDIVVTSYPLIRRDIEEYKEIDFRYCILDEAQHIKNAGSQNAKAVKQVRAGNRYALTGTPMENSLVELWSIFDFVLQGYLFSAAKFTEKYERPIIKDENKKTLEELGKHIKPFILRRLKLEVLKELPEKIEHKIVAELTQEQKKVYLAFLEKIKSEIDKDIKENGFAKSQIKILAGLTRLRQICCHPALFLEEFEGESGKMQLLQEIVEEAIESGHRILLFSQFTSMLKIIQDWLKKKEIEYLYLDGSTKAIERGQLVKSFNEGQGKIFLISLKAGGTGLNLTGADTVIHYDPWWNPAVEDQATDRAYRIGQLKSVHVMKLITKGTIEEKIFALQENKKKLIDAVIQPGETMLSKMSEEDVRALFE